MVCGTYNYSYWGLSKPTNITGGAHIEDIARCCKISHVVVVTWFYQRTSAKSTSHAAELYTIPLTSDLLLLVNLLLSQQFNTGHCNTIPPDLGKPIIIPTILYNVGPPVMFVGL